MQDAARLAIQVHQAACHQIGSGNDLPLLLPAMLDIARGSGICQQPPNAEGVHLIVEHDFTLVREHSVGEVRKCVVRHGDCYTQSKHSRPMNAGLLTENAQTRETLCGHCKQVRYETRRYGTTIARRAVLQVAPRRVRSGCDWTVTTRVKHAADHDGSSKHWRCTSTASA